MTSPDRRRVGAARRRGHSPNASPRGTSKNRQCQKHDAPRWRPDQPPATENLPEQPRGPLAAPTLRSSTSGRTGTLRTADHGRARRARPQATAGRAPVAPKEATLRRRTLPQARAARPVRRRPVGATPSRRYRSVVRIHDDQRRCRCSRNDGPQIGIHSAATDTRRCATATPVDRDEHRRGRRDLPRAGNLHVVEDRDEHERTNRPRVPRRGRRSHCSADDRGGSPMSWRSAYIRASPP